MRAIRCWDSRSVKLQGLVCLISLKRKSVWMEKLTHILKLLYNEFDQVLRSDMRWHPALLKYTLDSLLVSGVLFCRWPWPLTYSVSNNHLFIIPSFAKTSLPSTCNNLYIQSYCRRVWGLLQRIFQTQMSLTNHFVNSLNADISLFNICINVSAPIYFSVFFL